LRTLCDITGSPLVEIERRCAWRGKAGREEKVVILYSSSFLPHVPGHFQNMMTFTDEKMLNIKKRTDIKPLMQELFIKGILHIFKK